MKIISVEKGIAIGAGVLSGVSLILIIGFVFANGLPELITNPHLLVGKYEFGSENITILPSIVSTLMAVALSLVIAVPVGIMTAVFLNEYTKKNSILVKIIRTAIDILSGVPSIVYGLFGMITFVKVFGGSSSIIAGSLTVSIMLLPTIVRSTEESLKSVSDSLREGSFALGAGKLRTIFKIALPSALPGIMSAVILSMGRVISESAPFLYTMGSVISAMPTGYGDSGATLAVALYQLSGEGWYLNEAYATAVVLIVIVLSLNFLAEFISNKLTRKLKGV
ncbi:MAG: phosphate ABC transporter permease PstA [Clostridiales bacterium]|nr:phosphate ABC transporter permease PstA [Clostridiales bacterium]MDD7488905.1 phosphate ABC transporter permease PstA [Clostridiales bacterium]